MPCLVVLVHSPLVGPRSWGSVATCLARAGVATVVPVLRDSAASDEPYWRQEAASVARELETVPADQPLVLAGHSGAGPLLPAIARAVRQPVVAQLYVDAGLPHGRRSRLDEMAANNADFAAQLRTRLAAGERFPEWREDDLRDLVPDAALRRGLVAELRPRPLAFFTELLPDYSEQPELPGGYILFSAPYASQMAAARRRGWPCREFAAGHFHLLADPEAVAAALRDLLAELMPAAN
jgi:hypothetical protein